MIRTSRGILSKQIQHDIGHRRNSYEHFLVHRKHSPGGSYSYCNTDYVLLGMVITSVTGKSVSSQIRERILTPLALNHTYLEAEESHSEPVAHPWDSGYDFSAIPVTAHFTTLWTAGGIISTAENMGPLGQGSL